MRLLFVLALVVLTASGAMGAPQSDPRAESKVRVGIFNLQSHNGDNELSAKATDELRLLIADFGFYEIHTQEIMAAALQKIGKKLPKRCRDPRCVLDVGGALGLDRMISGSIDEHQNRYGVQLTLIDVIMQQTIQEINVEGEPGMGAMDIIKTAVMRLHGHGEEKDSDKLTQYYGPRIHNEKEFLVSTLGFVGVGLLWGLVNYSYENTNSRFTAEYDDDPLSGHVSSADQIPMFARPAALANCYVAASDDAYGVLYNPAGMAWVAGPEAVMAYQYRFGVNNFAASYVNKATREIGFGQALLYSGDPEGIFTEMYFVSAFAYKFNRLLPFLRPISLGVNLKLANDRVKSTSPDSPGGSSFGIGMDIGLLWELSEKIRYGFLFRDAPVINKWKNVSTGERYFEPQAATLHMGGAFQAGYTTFLIAEGQLPLYPDQEWKMAGGIEQEIFGMFVFRAGIQKEIQTTFDAPWKITGGFGLRLDTESIFGRNLSLDGSYEYNTIRVFDVMNVSFRFGF